MADFSLMAPTPMATRFLALVLGFLIALPAFAQKQRVERDADLPRFTYKIDGKLEDVVRDEAKFRRFAAELRRDTESVLAKYDIADKAAQRQYMTVLVMLDFLEGRYDQAAAGARAVRALEEKPADKLTSGMAILAMIEARKKAGDMTSEAYRTEFGRILAADLRSMPYAVIENNAKGAKSSAELIGESLVLGNVRDRLQPVVDKSGGMLSSDLAPGIVAARYSLVARLPLKQTTVDVYSSYLAANKVEKADIWAPRAVQLPAGGKYSPVRIAVWDSGVDSAIFKSQVVTASGKPAVIAFDRYANSASGELSPIPAELQSKLPSMKSRTKGLSDLRSNVDSPEAAEVKKLLSGLKKEEFKGVVEELGLAGNYVHGTHVAGIAMEGNPHAQLVIARIEFDYHLLPDPCPSKELSLKGAKNSQAYVDFLKAQRVRVVNMSWGGSVRDYERALEECNVGKGTEERKALARELFDIENESLRKAMASAPEILFITAAGNSNTDASFGEFTPANLVLPNLLTVGAVDKAGDEAPFTSYGPTVKVHANGYQVESYLPGGDRVALSGTSMSAPQVTNLAGKILAVNPKLTPAEVIALIQSTSEKTADNRRTLINPAKAVSAAQARG
jgi:subtilisin family serine protease